MGTWERAIRERFGERDDLGIGGVWARFWSHLPAEEFEELARLLQDEYGLQIGLLRPDDALSKLWTPVPTQNPLRWLQYRTAEGDRWSELNHALVRRCDRRRLPLPRPPAMTVDELVRAWCGETTTRRAE
jgi:hypothetical protein